ncbi:D-amino acid dehydrogenase [Variovorax sp. J22R133]|uniref:D-amino acid dehydrogenase n=1 Tax=Variovorax brevis TaxID=3053503 RepID=UPI0025781E84|nr:D-amino acid dehydrogenase [Variovorax sp. J22R133]MDM0113593.1 D-amino acid dehydrogenase [Variovorax sp. J22R133]
MHICVLGAGIVGLATAWQLQRDGHQVSVIDRSAPGHGASGGNGAQLSYSYVQPLADPSIWKQLPKLLFSPTSPLKLRPQLDPVQWRWGLAFLAACNARTSRETTVLLLELAAASRAGFEQMMAEVQPECDFSATGKLVLYASATAVEGARRQLQLQRELGSTQRMVTPDECITLEPALAHYRDHVAGAVYTPGECAADCLKVCAELTRVLAHRGVGFHLGTDVQGFECSEGRVKALRTSAGPFEADAFVMALGTASQRLGRELGAYLPVYPLKGYSITVDIDDTPGAAPIVNVTDSARKVVFARIGSRLRVAGMAELVGHDASIPAERIETLTQATRDLFPHCSHFDDVHPWTGMRPATPTGVPIIGRCGRAPSNMLFNTGHGALGFTLAFGSALRISKEIGAAA